MPRAVGVDRLAREELVAFEGERIVEHLSHHCIAKVTVGLFDEQVVLEFAVGAEEGKGVFVSTLSFGEFQPAYISCGPGQ